MRIRKFLLLLLLMLVPYVLWGQSPGERVRTGAEVLIDRYLGELQGKRVGLVMNPTARIGDTHLLDTLMALDLNITALFAPEHGFRGEAGAGETIEDGVDRATGLPVYSLYGDTRKPTDEMLQKVDILLFDMQDVGARFYTYNVTLGLVLEAAAERDVPVWVLDRPNPAGGDYVAGWVLEEEFESFVGAYPIPMAHGMTLGELARMMIGEQWISFERKPRLRVIPMEGWKRSMKWPGTGLDWYPPSPNLPTFEHAYLYLGTVLFEGTTLSEGRGTPDPFLTLGGPGVQLDRKQLEQFRSDFPALEITRTTFTPRSIPGKAADPKHEGVLCRGVNLRVLDYHDLDPVRFGSRLLNRLLSSSPEAETIPYLYNLAGIRFTPSEPPPWQKQVEAFRSLRKPYLLY